MNMRIFPHLRKITLTENFIFCTRQEGQQFSGNWFLCEIFHITVTGTKVIKTIKNQNDLLEFILSNSHTFSFRKKAVCISYFLPSGIDLQQDTSALCPLNIFFSLPSYVSYRLRRTTCSKVLYLIAVLENSTNVSGKELWRSKHRCSCVKFFRTAFSKATSGDYIWIRKKEWDLSLDLTGIRSKDLCNNYRTLRDFNVNHNDSDYNGPSTHNHVVRKLTLNHSVKVVKWLNCVVSTYLCGTLTVSSHFSLYFALALQQL